MASNADATKSAGSNDSQKEQATAKGHPLHQQLIPEFQPARFLRCRHRQTLAGAYLPGVKYPHQAHKHVVTLPDGDQVALHDDRPTTWGEGDRCVLMIHGLVGCHLAPYLRRIGGKLRRHNVRVFRLDLRGNGSSAHLAQNVGHAGRSEDAAACVKWIHHHCRQSPISLVGFSMGGNIALKALGEAALGGSSEALPRVDNAVAVAPPIRLRECCDNLRLGFNRVYDRSFAKSLFRLARLRQESHPEADMVELPPRPRGVREFDDRVTAPLSGFRDANDYYEQCSAANLLRHITTPTLLLTAADDPLIPFSIFDESEMSSAIRFHATSHGGHLGFVGRRGVDADRRWMDWRVIDAVLSKQQKDQE